MITIRTRFDEKNQIACWKDRLARELNQLLLLSRTARPAFRKTILSIVRRVAEFEDVKIKRL